MVSGPSTAAGELRTLSRWFVARKMWKLQTPSSDQQGASVLSQKFLNEVSPDLSGRCSFHICARSVVLVKILALSPLGERVARLRRFLQPGRAR